MDMMHEAHLKRGIFVVFLKQILTTCCKVQYMPKIFTYDFEFMRFQMEDVVVSLAENIANGITELPSN